jgi:hypothetical protein
VKTFLENHLHPGHIFTFTAIILSKDMHHTPANFEIVKKFAVISELGSSIHSPSSFPRNVSVK